jgi:tetratricopeptide (TPR) repeat protein
LVVAGFLEDLETGGILVLILVEVFFVAGVASWIQQGLSSRNARKALPGLLRPGISKMEEGDYLGAAEYFEKTAEKVGAIAPEAGATLLCSAASARMRAGDRTGARALLIAVQESGWPKLYSLKIPLGSRLDYARALLEAVEGNLEEGRYFLDQALSVLPPRLKIEFRVVEAVLLWRKGEEEEARKALKEAQSWPADSRLRASLMGVLSGYFHNEPSYAAKALQDLPPGSMEWLWITWPELKTWLGLHSLL